MLVTTRRRLHAGMGCPIAQTLKWLNASTPQSRSRISHCQRILRVGPLQILFSGSRTLDTEKVIEIVTRGERRGCPKYSLWDVKSSQQLKRTTVLTSYPFNLQRALSYPLQRIAAIGIHNEDNCCTPYSLLVYYLYLYRPRMANIDTQAFAVSSSSPFQ